MSAGALNVGDEPEVVGEPVSEPHRAAVVGEPPEGMAPVLGEPVPIANGDQPDKLPVSVPSAVDSIINGVHEDAISEGQPVDLSGPSAVEVRSASEEVSAPDQSATENATSPEPSTEASNVPTGDAEETKTDTEFPSDVEVTHMAEVPTPPPPEIETASTANPHSVMEDESQVSSEGVAKVESAVKDQSLDTTPSANDVKEPSTASVPSVEDEQPAESPAIITDTHEEAPKQSTDNDLSSSKDGSKEIQAPEPTESDEVNDAEKGDFPVSSQHGDVESTAKVGYEAEKVVCGDNDTREVNSAEVKLGEVEKVVSEQEALPEVGSSEEVSSGKSVEQAGFKASDAQPEIDPNENVSVKDGGNHGQSNSTLSSEAFSTDSRAVPSEQLSSGKKPSDEATLGENGFQINQDAISSKTEQGASKDHGGSAKEKEKPTSFLKLPFIFATVVIAVAGVAIASFSRSNR